MFDTVRYVWQLARDNAMFLLEGAPCMYRELCFPVKSAGDLPQQNDRVAIVTGGSRGIGLEAVKVLLKLNMHVIVGSTNVDSARAALDPLVQEADEQSSGGARLDVWPLDLCRQRSIDAFCQRFISTELPLHVLLCNAGIMFYPRHQLTEDDFEMQLAVNHLGHLRMQHLLMPRLVAAGSADRHARIVNVSSAAHNCGSVNLHDIMLTRFYSPKGAYFHSKGAQIMCSNYLARLLSEQSLPVSCVSLHPGVIYTELYNYTTLYKFLAPVLKRIWRSARDGAETLLFAAVSPEAERLNGAYLENASVHHAAAYTQNRDDQDVLWNLSCQLCKIDEFGKPRAVSSSDANRRQI